MAGGGTAAGTAASSSGLMGASSMRATQLEAIKAQLLRSLGVLRSLKEELAPGAGRAGRSGGALASRGVGRGGAEQPDPAQQLDTLAAQLTDCEQVCKLGVRGEERAHAREEARKERVRGMCLVHGRWEQQQCAPVP